MSPSKTEPSIWSDLVASVNVWRAHPLLPTIGVALSVGITLSNRRGPGVIVALLLGLYQAGFLGAARIWYLRAFRGLPFEPHELWPFVRAFMVRFVVLGLIVLGLVLPVLLAAFLPLNFDHRAGSGIHPWSLPLLWGVFIGVDFALTFVTPALSYSTRRVRTAFRLGLRMIRDEWPLSAPYVLIPPLAVGLAVQAIPHRRLWTVAAAASLVSELIAMAFRGAIARYYLRHVEVGDDGAAFVHKDPAAPPAPPPIPPPPP
jgi:hypothetical protein